MARIKATPGVIVTHNHPEGTTSTGTPFSQDDLRSAAALDLAEIRAVTTTATYRIRPVTTWPTVKAIDKAWSGMWWKGLDRTSDSMVKHGMTKEAALKKMNQWGMGQLATQLGLDYTACREDDPRKEVAR